MRLICLGFLAIAACEPDPATSARSTSATLRASAPTDLSEADYRGAFHGANVYVTIEIRGALASGTCFYESDGRDVPLRGAIDERGVLTLEELDDRRAISSITLTLGANGAWAGTWKTSDLSRSGAARLERITHREGDPVLVVTKRIERRAGEARIPVVLGLEDRAFEHKLDDALSWTAKRAPTAIIDYAVPLNAHGFASFELSAKYACDLAPCALKKSGVSAAIDAHELATEASELIDMVKARPALVDAVKHGAACTADLDDDHALALVRSGVLTPRGVSVFFDGCDDRIEKTDTRELTFAELGPALRVDWKL